MRAKHTLPLAHQYTVRHWTGEFECPKCGTPVLKGDTAFVGMHQFAGQGGNVYCSNGCRAITEGSHPPESK